MAEEVGFLVEQESKPSDAPAMGKWDQGPFFSSVERPRRVWTGACKGFGIHECDMKESRADGRPLF